MMNKNDFCLKRFKQLTTTNIMNTIKNTLYNTMMTYEEYTRDDRDVYEYHIKQEYTNQIERFKQELQQYNRYVQVDIHISYAPFDVEFKRDEYNDYKKSYQTIIDTCINTLFEHPLYNHESVQFTPIVSNPIEELIVEPSMPIEQSRSIDEPMDILEDTDDEYKTDEYKTDEYKTENDDELPPVFTTEQILESDHDKLLKKVQLYNSTKEYFKEHITDDIKNDVVGLLELLYNCPLMEIVSNDMCMNTEYCSDELISRLKSNDYRIKNTFQSIIDDFKNERIKSPSHIKNMIYYITRSVRHHYLGNDDEVRDVLTDWNDAFRILCVTYQQHVKKEKCKNIPKNMDEILCNNMTQFVLRMLNQQNTMPEHQYRDIERVFRSLPNGKYRISLLFSMCLFYSPVRPCVIRDLYWLPTDEQNGFTINEQGQYVFHKNVDKTKNPTHEVIDNPIICMLLDELLDGEDLNEPFDIYLFSINGKRNAHFNDRIFKPVMQVLGDTENTIYDYNGLRSLVATKDFERFFDGLKKRGHSLTTVRQNYLTTFGKPIEQ